MPPRTSRKKQLKAAREALLEKQTTIAEDSDQDVDSLKNCLYKAVQQTQLLEQQLADQAKVCVDLQDNFHTSQDLIKALRAEILSLKSKNSDIYHQLCMERQCSKCTTSKNTSITSQILLLKKAFKRIEGFFRHHYKTFENK